MLFFENIFLGLHIRVLLANERNESNRGIRQPYFLHFLIIKCLSVAEDITMYQQMLDVTFLYFEKGDV